MFYTPSIGPGVSANIMYKLQWTERDRPARFDTNLPSLGRQWFLGWIRYVEVENDGDTNGVFFSGRGTATAIVAGGDVAYQNQSKWTYSTNGFTEIKRNGSRDFYEKRQAGIDQFNGAAKVRFFLTRSQDVIGNSLTFKYSPVTNGSAVSLRMVELIDGNGLTNSISYTNSPRYASLISSITGPFGHSVSLTYTNYSLQGVGETSLSGVVDAVGIDTRFEYDSDGDLIAMRTPYGRTQFDTRFATSEIVTRIVQPNGGQHVYLFGKTFSTDLIPDTIPSGPPNTTNGTFYAISNNFANTSLNLWNSLHWGPRQVELLSTGAFQVVNAGGGALIQSLTADDVAVSRLRHWLAQAGGGNASTTLAYQRNPSPEIGQVGFETWYDHAGKPDSETVGSMPWPRLVASKLPGGESRFKVYTRSSNGGILEEQETYSGTGGVQLRATTYTFASNGVSLLRVTNSLGKEVFGASYNSQNLPVAITNAGKGVTTFTYNGSGQKLTVTDGAGLVTTYGYIGTGVYSGRLSWTRQHEVVSGTNKYYTTNWFGYYDGHISSVTDARGNTNLTWRDGLHRIVGVVYGDGTTISNRYSLTSNSFSNSSGGNMLLRPVQSKDRMGNWTTFGYNSLGQVVSNLISIDGVDVSTRWTYCVCGALETCQDAEGEQVSYSYDRAGRRTGVQAAGARFVSLVYDSANRPISLNDGVGTVSLALNNQGMVAGVSNGVGSVRQVAFDVLDRRRVVSNGAGMVLNVDFDDLDRPVSLWLNGGGTQSMVYGSRGLLRVVDGLGITNALYGYDAQGRVVAQTNANGEVIAAEYTDAGELGRVIDGRGNTTEWQYDRYGRLTNKVDAMGRSIVKYGYDQYGRVTNRWTPKGSGINVGYSMNSVGWITNVAYPNNPGESFAYDRVGRLVRMVDGVGTTHWTYEDGLLLSEDGPWPDDTLALEYSNRHRSRLAIEQPGGTRWTQEYEWDDYGRLRTTSSRAGAFAYEYLGGVTGQPAGFSGLLKRLSIPNQTYITNQFDTGGRLTSTLLIKQGTAIAGRAYTYNLRDAVESETRSEGGRVDFAYDKFGRLVQAIGKEAGGTNRLHEMLSYGYDAVGNLHAKTNNLLVQLFGYDSANQISGVSNGGTLTVSGVASGSPTNVTVNGLTAQLYGDGAFARAGIALTGGSQTFTAIGQDGIGRKHTNAIVSGGPSSVTFSYDGNGNMLGDGRRALVYDDLDQLIQVVVTNGPSDSTRSSFKYDGLRRKRVQLEEVWRNGSWVLQRETRYIYDGMLVVQERDSYNQPTLALTRGLGLVLGSQSQGCFGGILARSELSGVGESHSYAFGDSRGSVLLLADEAGRVVARYAYDSYGGLLSGSGPLAFRNLYRYASKEYHEQSGLIAFGYRFYDPGIQRWINRDTIGEAGGLNLYEAFGGTPTGFGDPDGKLIISLLFTAVDLYNLTQNIANGTAGWQDVANLSVDAVALATDIFTGGIGGDGVALAARGGLAAVKLGRAAAAIGKGAKIADGISVGGHVGVKLCEALAMTGGPSSSGSDHAQGESGGGCDDGRPTIRTKLDDRVTSELPPGVGRTPAENAAARRFFRNHLDDAERWYETRTGFLWPNNATHHEHPRSLKEGGDPLFVVPGYGGPAAPHMIPGADGLTDFQRWGRLGGRPRMF
jgi:RHS repeat-associated protein